MLVRTYNAGMVLALISVTIVIELGARSEFGVFGMVLAPEKGAQSRPLTVKMARQIAHQRLTTRAMAFRDALVPPVDRHGLLDRHGSVPATDGGTQQDLTMGVAKMPLPRVQRVEQPRKRVQPYYMVDQQWDAPLWTIVDKFTDLRLAEVRGTSEFVDVQVRAFVQSRGFNIQDVRIIPS